MRKEKYAEKLAALLGGDLQKLVPTVATSTKGKKGNNTSSSHIGVSESEIQNFRQAQGILYFLQAPELFSAKVCKHCGEGFLVSRQFVSCCSYTCIRKELEAVGINWSKGKDLEALAQDPNVYEGNEPIWVRNLDRIQAILSTVQSTEESRDSELTSVGS